MGGFRGGYFDGHAVLTYPDGERFEGEFVNGDPLTEGVYLTAKGMRFEGRVRDVGNDISQPHTVARYPFWRALLGGEANVVIFAIISEEGRVTSAMVVIPTKYPSFNAAAVEAVKQWKYLPATLEGQPIKMPHSINLQFAQPG